MRLPLSPALRRRLATPVAVLALALVGCWPATPAIEALSRENLSALSGMVRVSELPGPRDDDVICLLGPYDEVFLRFGPVRLPDDVAAGKLEPLLPVEGSEFIIALFSPGGEVRVNRYARRDGKLDIVNRSESLPPPHDALTVCAEVSTALHMIRRGATGLEISLHVAEA